MAAKPDSFRDFGILPHDVAPPAETVRAYFSMGHVIGQYIATVLLSGIGIGMALLFALTASFPTNVLAPVAVFAGCGYLVYLVTRNDYVWVELQGHKLRAQHLYTRRVVERSIEDIDDLLTLVIQRQALTTAIVDSLLGRIRGIMIRFRDKRTPLQVCRTDPAMRNARELIEAIIYRMSEKGKVDAEITQHNGKPLIRRIYWKERETNP